MYVDGDALVLSPTDLTKHLACAHLTTLDLAAARGEITVPATVDESLALIFERGLDHEKAYLAWLSETHKVVTIDGSRSLEDQVAATREAMRAGAAVIYQATFLHEGRRGHADFLLRVDRPSDLGDWSYDVADTKLARRMKVAALVQMAEYGRHLARIQGQPPEVLVVVTGDGEERPFRYADAAAYAMRASGRLQDAVRDEPRTRAQPNSHCLQCSWQPRCKAAWRAADHLSLVAFMRTDHRELLEAAGVTTVAQLAASDPRDLPAEIGLPTRERLQRQAFLQMEERRTGSPHYELLDPEPGLGLLRLPQPDPGDVYLDFEGDPWANGGEGREYLAGLWDRGGRFTTWWAHDADEERVLTRDLLVELNRRLDANPGMHVYHYAPYERSALARLTQRHGVAEIELDRLLRGEVLVDLYAVVRQGLRISKESYSIKKMEAFYWGHVRQVHSTDDGVADALSSVVQYEKWLLDRENQAILDGIAAYNSDDVRSTHDLHAWLEERRAELEARDGQRYPRPLLADVPELVFTAEEQVEVDLAEDLHAAGEDVLAGLVGWHRREARPQWWDFFRVEGVDDEDLVRDAGAIGGLGPPIEVGKQKRSTIWRYRFPSQDTKVSKTAWDVDTHASCGAIVALDATEGWIDVTIGNNRTPAGARGFGPDKPFDDKVMRGSLRRTARDVLDGGSPLALSLLRRIPPSGVAPADGETATETVVRAGRTVAGTVLAVQGPPGSGKTYAGAELIRALLDEGKTVGVTAQSHAVIGNLLRAVGRRALHKCDEHQQCGVDGVEHTNDNADVEDALVTGTHQLVGGTAWLWAREGMEATVDVLVIDEAGQFSLAQAVAVSRAARGLVLLGDPQQLASPTQALHPDGAGVSALDHWLGDHVTMPADAGVFLDRTWRMHPSITSVVSTLMYEGRLASVPGLERQALLADGLPAQGVVWRPVEHLGHASASTEEAAVVAELTRRILAGSWQDAKGVERAMTLDDVLVVAPYNAHVARLRAALPAGARIGTVDKFQGQEAPVVIYSMASSSAADAPRGVSFLYDLHRLNVAISRARCVAVVIGAPALLDAPVTSPENLRRVNGLLTVVDAASAAGR